MTASKTHPRDNLEISSSGDYP